MTIKECDLFPSQGGMQLGEKHEYNSVPMCLLPLSFLVIDVAYLGGAVRAVDVVDDTHCI